MEVFKQEVDDGRKNMTYSLYRWCASPPNCFMRKGRNTEIHFLPMPCLTSVCGNLDRVVPLYVAVVDMVKRMKSFRNIFKDIVGHDWSRDALRSDYDEWVLCA